MSTPATGRQPLNSALHDNGEPLQQGLLEGGPLTVGGFTYVVNSDVRGWLLTNTHKLEILTHGLFMRTNIDIDDDLMRDAMRASGDRTKRGVVERGLRLLIDTKEQGGIRRLRGKVKWKGDLRVSRTERVSSD